jgi:hypothetical protein
MEKILRAHIYLFALFSFLIGDAIAAQTWQAASQQQLQSPPPPEVEHVRNLPQTPRPALQTPPQFYHEAPTYSEKIIRMPESQTFNTLTFYPGSLKENIQRIAKECGWNVVVWKTPYDYNWVGTTHFVDSYLPDILHKVLNGFPLQAVFYEGNHILVIVPRNIS